MEIESETATETYPDERRVAQAILVLALVGAVSVASRVWRVVR